MVEVKPVLDLGVSGSGDVKPVDGPAEDELDLGCALSNGSREGEEGRIWSEKCSENRPDTGLREREGKLDVEGGADIGTAK
jgi:hypothetical protein